MQDAQPLKALEASLGAIQVIRSGPVLFLALLLSTLVHHGGERLDAAG